MTDIVIFMCYDEIGDTMQTLRLFEILYILLQQRKATAVQLAEHFEVSVRTIYRDLDALTLAGIPIYTNKGRNGGIFLKEDYVLNRSCFSDEEQNKILSALQSLQIVDKEDSELLLSKLSAIFQKPNTPWIQVDFSDWSDDYDKDIFQIFRSAILNYQVVTFLYYDSYGNSKQRSVEPLQLLFKGQAWYLVAYCRLSQGQRTFKIKRMRNIEVTEERFVRELIETKHHYQQYQMEMMQVVLQIDKSMGYRVFEEFPREQIEEYEDHFLLHTRIPQGEMTIPILLSYGPSLTILEPIELRNRMKSYLNQMLDHYK